MRSHPPARSHLAAILAALLASIALPVHAEETPAPAATPPAVAPPATPPARACRTTPADAAAASPRLDQANMRFALDLLTGLAAEGKTNVAVSPFGVAAVLAALDLGADARMKAAIAHSLRLDAVKGGKSMEILRKDIRWLTKIGKHPDGPFATADALFVDQALKLAPGIEDLIEGETDITLKKLDFGSAAAIAEVNHWAAEKTGGRITTILEPGTGPSLVAVNAFAFKDCWRFKFDSAATAPKPFHRLDGTIVQPPTMALDTQELAYAAKGGFAAVELPYADGRFALTLVTTLDAPAAPAAFAGAGDLLNGTGLKPTQVRVTLPKFTGTADHDLLGLMSKFGLGTGLASKTPFSGFGAGLNLTALRQKTFVAVDETGTEAAAVTAAVMSRGVQQAPTPVAVNFDRPFVYVLRHPASGTILMAGYVVDPGA